MCGLQVDVEDDARHADPWRPRRRVVEGLPVPEGHDARPPARRPRPHPRADGARRRHVARGVVGRGVRALRGADPRRARAPRHRVRAPRSSATRSATASRSVATCRCSSGSRACRTSTRRAPSTSGPRTSSCVLMYGNMWKIPAPDIQRTDYLICMGGNPQASGGSLLACPDVLGELDDIRARGGKVVVVDPRRTGTADHADEWVPILPGTDAAFLLAMCNVLFAEGLTTLGDARRHGEGRRRRARAVRRRSRPSRSRRSAACPPTRSGASRASSRPRPPARCTDASGCATRSSARSRRGSSTW